jgi:signal transduction histidine kinase
MQPGISQDSAVQFSNTGKVWLNALFQPIFRATPELLVKTGKYPVRAPLLLDDRQGDRTRKNMNSHAENRYEILRALAVAGAGNNSLAEAGQVALEQTAGMLGIEAAALFLWNEAREITLQVSYSSDEALAARLDEIETDLFEALRRERALVSAYMSFGGDSPCHSFTLPLRHGDRVFGAVVGLQKGKRTALAEDAFLDALAATIALNAIAGGQVGAGLSQDDIDRERLAAITETAVTVNHEINNPLTAIIGNVQLMLMHRDDLDDELRKKLSVIEESASRIKEVTQKLLRLSSGRSTEYTSGTSMLDLSDTDDPEDSNGPKAQ